MEHVDKPNTGVSNEENPSNTEKDNNRILLKNNLDQLLYDKNYSVGDGGLFLPSGNDPGTGNIVIKGSAGTGKSTLAFQFLYQTVFGNVKDKKPEQNPCYSLYFSLEEHISHLACKMRNLFPSDKNQIRELLHLQNSDNTTSPEALAGYIRRILDQPSECPIQKISKNPYEVSKDACKEHKDSNSCVLLPSLTPKGIDHHNSNAIFWQRYKQIENYLIADKYIRENGNAGTVNPQLKMVCIDSLNVFGDNHLEREEIFKLFDLFKRYGVIGVFVFESVQDRLNDGFTQMSVDIDFSADVIISLQHMQDKGYTMRFLEIVKSRYKAQVYGKHPYYIINNKSKSNPDFLPFWVYPSLHYKMNEFAYLSVKTDGSNDANRNSPKNNEGDNLINTFTKWRKQFKNIIPSSFSRKCTIMLSGPRNTFKSVIARDFLLAGLKDDINGLIISMDDIQDDHTVWWKYVDNIDMPSSEYTDVQSQNKNYDPNVNNSYNINRHILEVRQLDFNPGHIIRIVIKKKAIQAEELIHHVQNILDKGLIKNINRAVLDEINMIGTSYPFLHTSSTSGELFLNAFTTLMKEKNIDLIITGTTGETQQGDEIIKRAASLSDTTLTTRFCDVFGKQNIIYTGKGLIANQKYTEGDELIPGVLRVNETEKLFSIDYEYMRGLIGFEQGKVFRPGLTINLFEEGELQKIYNEQISALYKLSFPEHTYAGTTGDSEKKIYISTFNDRDVEAMRDVVERIRDNTPLEGTVVSMMDEYWSFHSVRENNNSNNNQEKNESNKQNESDSRLEHTGTNAHRRIYYTNCMVLAFRKDKFKNINNIIDAPSWEKIFEAAKQAMDSLPENKRKDKRGMEICLLDSDFYISETLSCLLLNSIQSSFIYQKNKNEKYSSAFEEFKEEPITDTLISELFYMHHMFNDKDRLCSKEKRKTTDKERQKIYTNCMMYVCWYTQLRELLYKEPSLISEIGIRGLPGGGFRGDWMIEVMPGSLSNSLGTSTLDLLCKPEEEIKRFIQGVGLPAWFNKGDQDKDNMSINQLNVYNALGKLPVWIGASDTLDDLQKIYNKSRRRSDIHYYDNYRYMLSITFRRLMTIPHTQRKKFEEDARLIISELIQYIQNCENKNPRYKRSFCPKT